MYHTYIELSLFVMKCSSEEDICDRRPEKSETLCPFGKCICLKDRRNFNTTAGQNIYIL